MMGMKEQHERGFSFVDNYVCADCIEEEYLSKFVEDNGELGLCSYCKQQKMVLDFDKIVDMIVNGFNAEYENPANCVGYSTEDGGYQLRTLDTYDLLFKEGIGPNVHYDVLRSIRNTDWIRKNPYSDEKYIELLADWETFSNEVKYNKRYLFIRDSVKDKYGFPLYSESYQILKYIGDQVSELGLIKTMPAGSILFRARFTKSHEKFKSVKQLGPPPSQSNHYAKRMSPAGISFFYGAMDRDTCFREIIQPGKKCKATIAAWETLHPLKMLDITFFSDIPSLFDEENRWMRTPLSFLVDFREDFTKPIKKDGREHIEYVPTQVLTEYFRTIYRIEHEEIDGILYPSSKNNGTSCVIFCGPEGCCSINYKHDDTKLLCLVPKSIEVRKK